MPALTFFRFAVMTFLFSTCTDTRAQVIDNNSPPPNISTLPEGSLFATWRPKAHVLPPSGHIGDPTGHYVDPETGLFHVGYLHTTFTEEKYPGGAAAATTADFVTYKDIDTPDPRFIKPGGINDPLAVFDGTVIAPGYQGKPTFIYTAVSFLPISWTRQYIPGSESQAMAVSYDGGKNFTKLERGPVIPAAPFGLNVTGWRDPFAFQDPKLDLLLDSKNDAWYILISGGEHDVGPTQFLYRQYDSDFLQWEYLGRLWQESANTTWGDGTWAGRWGFNFEVANVFRIGSEGADLNGEFFGLVCTEGGKYGVQGGRAQLWAAGDLSPPTNETVSFNVNMAGVFDWGASAYAAAGKLVPATSAASQSSGAPDRYIAWIWLTGNFFETVNFPARTQGWDSSLLTPRELYMETIHNVVDNNAVRETGSWRILNNESKSGVVDIVTLGIKPVREAITAYVKQASKTFTEPDRTFASTDSNIVPFSQALPESRHYVLSASISFPPEARNSANLCAGFKILSSEHESTGIYYQFSNESFVVDRSNSTAVAHTTDGIDTRNEAGKFRLWDIQNPSDGSVKMETLDLQIIVDNSIVEIFANNRFTLSTMVIPWYNASRGISFYCDGECLNVSYHNVTIHEGLVDAWPERT
ncbi:Arabinanase/levansucrase/invertase [Marasmius fiardii PR-910]|nr:Arabinanase/levansucrase/invertase [Marasmius fiardii PR-910]